MNVTVVDLSDMYKDNVQRSRKFWDMFVAWESILEVWRLDTPSFTV